MKTSTKALWIWVSLLLVGSWLLYRATPLETRNGVWPHNVLRNWQDFGLLNLKGQLVHNPGGAGLPEHPQVYSGHLPFIFYGAYLVDRAGGGCAEGWAFHLVLSLVVGLSVCRLLGNSTLGMVAAALVVFAPGYVRFVSAVDPVTVPVLLGLPLLYPMREILGREPLTAGGVVVAAVLVAVYAPLNWTTGFAFGIAGVYLAVALPHRLKRVVVFMAGTGLVAVLVVLVSLTSRVVSEGDGTASASSSRLFVGFFNQYLFGPIGYDGNPMTWKTALLRLTAANGVSLLPVWLFLLWLVWRAAGKENDAQPRLLLCLAPLLTSLAFIVGMRNYFAHHPWMAGPVILYGFVFSARLLLDRTGLNQTASATDSCGSLCVRTGLPALAGLAYGLMVMLTLSAFSSEVDSILRLVRSHTGRHDRIFFAPQEDVWIAQNAKRLGAMFDRALLPLTGAKADAPLPSGPGGQSFRLTTHVPSGDKTWLAQSKLDSSPVQQLVQRLHRWYLAHVAKRAKGDRLEPEGPFYLYRL
jgi:hypothetical protein